MLLTKLKKIPKHFNLSQGTIMAFRILFCFYLVDKKPLRLSTKPHIFFVYLKWEELNVLQSTFYSNFQIP
jgi:hypothetical protein